MEMCVNHSDMGDGKQALKISELKLTRPRGPIDAAAAQFYTAIFDKFFTPAAFAGLTAVHEYASLRDRAIEMNADLHRIELERQTAELEQQRIMASKATGESLATALSAAEEKQRAAAQRLQQSQAGARAFHARLSQAEADARDAIKGRFRTVLASAIADHASRNEAARTAMAAAVRPFLDQLAALEHAGVELGIHRDLEPRVEELLRTFQVQAGKRAL